LGSDPVGPLTGVHYPGSLVRPDPLGFEPRVAVSWRPIPASTVVVRAGYGERSRGAADRRTLSRFSGSPGPTRLRTASRCFVASHPGVDRRSARRLWRAIPWGR